MTDKIAAMRTNAIIMQQDAAELSEMIKQLMVDMAALTDALNEEPQPCVFEMLAGQYKPKGEI